MAFAAALLRGGVLQEADWNGELIGSIKRGIERWVLEVEPVGGMVAFSKLVFAYTDTIKTWHTSTRGWHAAFSKVELPFIQDVDEDEAPAALPSVGGFSLWATQWVALEAKWGVLEFEQIVPGLGWAILSLITQAANRCVPTADYAWGEEFAQWFYDCWCNCGKCDDCKERKENSEDTSLTPDNWRDGIPEEMGRSLWKPEIVHKAIRLLEARADKQQTDYGAHWTACHTALQLAQILKSKHGWSQWYSVEQHSEREERNEPALALAIRWDGNDNVERMVDDQHEYYGNAGFFTEMAWMHGFCADVPGSLDAAVEGLKQVFAVMAKLNTLMCLFDTTLESRIRQSTRVRVGA